MDTLAYKVYTPSSIVGVFNNNFKMPEELNLIHLKGKYSMVENRKEYAGYYYDLIRTEEDDISYSKNYNNLKLVNAEKVKYIAGQNQGHSLFVTFAISCSPCVKHIK